MHGVLMSCCNPSLAIGSRILNILDQSVSIFSRGYAQYKDTCTRIHSGRIRIPSPVWSRSLSIIITRMKSRSLTHVRSHHAHNLVTVEHRRLDNARGPIRPEYTIVPALHTPLTLHHFLIRGSVSYRISGHVSRISPVRLQ